MKCETVLLTQRLADFSLNTFLSNLAGSVLGILGGVGFLMNVLEEYYEIYQTRTHRTKNLKQIMKHRCEILDKNLSTNEKRITKEDFPSDTSKTILYRNGKLILYLSIKNKMHILKVSK
jgi:hypothetical protein